MEQQEMFELSKSSDNPTEYQELPENPQSCPQSWLKSLNLGKYILKNKEKLKNNPVEALHQVLLPTKVLPTYKILEADVFGFRKCRVDYEINEICLSAEGEGTSKKKAKQAAAQALYNQFIAISSPDISELGNNSVEEDDTADSPPPAKRIALSESSNTSKNSLKNSPNGSVDKCIVETLNENIREHHDVPTALDFVSTDKEARLKNLNLGNNFLRIRDKLTKMPVSVLYEMLTSAGSQPTFELLETDISGRSKCRVSFEDFTAEAEAASMKKAKHAAAQALINQLINVSLPDIKEESKNYSVENYIDKTSKEEVIEDVPPPTKQVILKQNFVGFVNEFCLLLKLLPPVFTELEISERPNNAFKIKCTVEDMETTGEGRNKKIAKQNAASEMVKVLQEIFDSKRIGENLKPQLNNEAITLINNGNIST